MIEQVVNDLLGYLGECNDSSVEHYLKYFCLLSMLKYLCQSLVGLTLNPTTKAMVSDELQILHDKLTMIPSSLDWYLKPVLSILNETLNSI
ncbi:hypothetical protein KKG41_04815 [Patescibacteria group bacterium]|nr:hypothetical protein [Patescibacteria group bacterium]MBU1890827.1 hypothetical protein [Patescibacteria group bacterium]